MIIVPVAGGLLTGIDRKLTARMQRRKGPPLLQPFYDVIKLLQKSSTPLNGITRFYVTFSLCFSALTLVMFFMGVDLLLCIFSFTLACFFFVIAGYSSYSPFSFAGTERELVQIMCYEPMILLTAFGYYEVTGTFSAAAAFSMPYPAVARMPLIFLGFCFILTIKLRKSPFDLSTSHHGHQELVKGITTELTGICLAMVEIIHWMETIFAMGLIYIMFVWAAPYSKALAAAVCLFTFFLEVIIDNSFARVKWRQALRVSMLEDERAIEAIPSIGFIHRGLEKLVEKKDFTEYVYVAERICGICSFMHGMGYCMAVENVMDIKVPDRAQFLRTIWAELSRVHSHLMWLGLLADAIGFESLFMHCWRMREQVLDIFDMTTGGRVIFSVCKVGGVRKDIDAEKCAKMEDVLAGMSGKIKELTDVFMRDSSVRDRLAGIGVLTEQDARDLGTVGPMARASGIVTDMRKLGYAAYPHVKFEVPVERDGDSFARTKIRIREIFEAISIIRQCLKLMPPDTVIETPFKGNPDGEYFARLELPRGQVLYYVKGNGTKFLDRMRVRTPTFANVPALVHMLKGVELADVPVLILTIDPCISCTER